MLHSIQFTKSRIWLLNNSNSFSTWPHQGPRHPVPMGALKPQTLTLSWAPCPETRISCPDPSCNSVFSPHILSSFLAPKSSLILALRIFRKFHDVCLGLSTCVLCLTLATTLGFLTLESLNWISEPSWMVESLNHPVTTPLPCDLVSLKRFAQSISSREKRHVWDTGTSRSVHWETDLVATLGWI